MNRTDQKKHFLEELHGVGFTDPMLEFLFDQVSSSEAGRTRILQRYNEGLAAYDLLFKTDPLEGPYLDSYTATVWITGSIRHLPETLALEERLREVDWTASEGQQRERSYHALPLIWPELERLLHVKDSKRFYIGAQLMTKYWLGTWVENHLKMEPFKELFERKYTFRNSPMASFTSVQAFNLLCGRPVLCYREKAPGIRHRYRYWLEENDGLLQINAKTCYMAIEAELAALPISNKENQVLIRRIARQLENGDLVEVSLSRDGIEYLAEVSLWPELDSIIARHKEVEPLLLNLIKGRSKNLGAKN